MIQSLFGKFLYPHLNPSSRWQSVSPNKNLINDTRVSFGYSVAHIAHNVRSGFSSKASTTLPSISSMLTVFSESKDTPFPAATLSKIVLIRNVLCSTLGTKPAVIQTFRRCRYIRWSPLYKKNFSFWSRLAETVPLDAKGWFSETTAHRRSLLIG